MSNRLGDLKRARVLITNDDGIAAVGLKVLERAIRRLTADVWVVAPETEQSAASHSLTMRRPLFVQLVGRRRFSVDGTPTDCVLLAQHRVLKDRPPDLVVSGINRGSNLGEDATYSGTIAAAMEGALLGIPSIAFSQVHSEGEPIDWSLAEQRVPVILARLGDFAWPPNVLLSINFPAGGGAELSDVEITRQGRHKIGATIQEGFDPRGRPYYWIGGERDEDRDREGTDLAAVHRGRISVTPLSLDLTDEPAVDRLRAVFP